MIATIRSKTGGIPYLRQNEPGRGWQLYYAFGNPDHPLRIHRWTDAELWSEYADCPKNWVMV